VALDWIGNKLARQEDKPKNVKPVVTSAEINKEREDVQYVCGPIMSRPKPRPKVTDSTPASGQQTPNPPPQKEEAKEAEPEVQEMDVD
jgi:heat shock protein 4